MLRQLFDTVNGKYQKSKKIATDSNYLRCHALLTALHFPLETTWSCKQDRKERYWGQQFWQMERDISVRPTEMTRPVTVDHLQSWSRIFRSDQTEMVRFIWCTNRNYRNIGLNGKRPRSSVSRENFSHTHRAADAKLLPKKSNFCLAINIAIASFARCKPVLCWIWQKLGFFMWKKANSGPIWNKLVTFFNLWCKILDSYGCAATTVDSLGKVIPRLSGEKEKCLTRDQNGSLIEEILDRGYFNLPIVKATI